MRKDHPVPKDPVVLFAENAAKAAAGVHVAAGIEEGRELLRSIVPAGAAVYCPAATEMEKAVADLFPGRTSGYADAVVTVEEVFGAVAETGSLACSSVGGRAVQAGLLPAHHVAIVRRDRIFDTLDDLFAALAAASPTNLTLVTGPSRTADIELTLAIGVHGPERLDILVV